MFGNSVSFKKIIFVPKKLINIAIELKEAGADVVVSGDMGCLMNIGGMIKRMGLDIKTMHIAQLLAGNFGNVERGGKR